MDVCMAMLGHTFAIGATPVSSRRRHASARVIILDTVPSVPDTLEAETNENIFHLSSLRGHCMAPVRYFRSAFVGGMLWAVALTAQTPPAGTITGRVVDSTSQQPLAGVTVLVEGTQWGGVTG